MLFKDLLFSYMNWCLGQMIKNYFEMFLKKWSCMMQSRYANYFKVWCSFKKKLHSFAFKANLTNSNPFLKHIFMLAYCSNVPLTWAHCLTSIGYPFQQVGKQDLCKLPFALWTQSSKYPLSEQTVRLQNYNCFSTPLENLVFLTLAEFPGSLGHPPILPWFFIYFYL